MSISKRKHLPDLMNSKHEWAFDTDGTMYETLTNEQALEIAIDFPPSVFLMDESNYKFLMNNREFAKKLIMEHDDSFEFISDDLKNDKEVVLEAVKTSWMAMDYVSDEIQSLVGNGDPVEILTKAIASEKLSARLTEQLKPKVESREQSMKMKI